jgi:hypothetical protein
MKRSVRLVLLCGVAAGILKLVVLERVMGIEPT